MKQASMYFYYKQIKFKSYESNLYRVSMKVRQLLNGSKNKHGELLYGNKK
jgi:hypothetical protein